MTRGRAGEWRYRAEPAPPQGKPLCGRLWRPCPAAGLAVAGFLEGEVKRVANPPSARSPDQEKHHMQAEDAELEQFRRGVNCAALLERGRRHGVWTGEKARAVHSNIAARRARS